MENTRTGKLTFINVGMKNGGIRIINTKFIVSIDEVTEGGKKYYEEKGEEIPKCYITLQGLDQCVNCYTYSIEYLQQILSQM